MSDCKVMQGDSRELVRDYLVDGSVNIVIADPPYGVDFTSRRAESAEQRKLADKKVTGDADVEGALELFDDVMLPLLGEKCAPEAECWVYTAWNVVDYWIQHLRTYEDQVGFKYKAMSVWSKGTASMGDIDSTPGCGHELILYLKRGRRDVNYRRNGIYEVQKVASGQNSHVTEKPVRLQEILIEQVQQEYDFLVDPFAGTGSSIVAAQRCGIDAVGFEMDEDYSRIANDRLSQLTLF